MLEVFASSGFDLLIVSLILAVFGIVVGFHYGNECGSRVTTSAQFWKYNIICYGVIVVFTALFIALDLPTFIFLCIGALGGFIAGIRKGYGESVGPWKAHDRFYKRHKKEKDASNVKTKASTMDGSVQHPRPKEQELISTQTEKKR